LDSSENVGSSISCEIRCMIEWISGIFPPLREKIGYILLSPSSENYVTKNVIKDKIAILKLEIKTFY
jgi:hypothetical protein